MTVTMARDQQSLQLPLRASSAQGQSPDFGDSQEDLRSEKSKNRTSKAQKVLGTTEIPMQQNNSPRDDTSSIKRRKARPSFMKSSLSPFPSANDADASDQQKQPPQLRVRASSPHLLPGTSHSHDAAPKKTVHHSGSSSALFSYFSSRDTSGDSENGKQPRPETSSLSLNSKGSKDSKRKLRPPRIDLSLLFPKPKPTAAPLLSPQRMVHSPSPLSAVGEFPKGANPETRPSGRRYTAAHSPTQATTTATATAGPPPVPPQAVLRPTSNRSAPADRSSAISTDTNFLEPPLHRTVRTSEMDMALQNYSELQQQQQQQQQQQRQQREKEYQQEQREQKEKREREQQEKQRQQREQEEQHKQQQEQEQQQAVERSQPDGNSSTYSRSQEQLHSGHSKSFEKTPHRMPSNSSMGGWSKETYLSPKSQPRMPRRHPSPSPGRRQMPPRSRESDYSTENKSSASRKSSKSNKSTLANSDLTTSSVLCLSSSEDEDDEEPANNRPSVPAIPRESVNTYGELEPEICTASAAQATKGRAVKRVDLHRQPSDSMKGGTMLRSPTIYRNPSMSSAGRSSYAGRKAAPRRSSGIPTISEPNILSTNHFPVPGGGHPPLSAKEIRRRSRVIAVTRQEEDLLEAMRLRKGKVTRSLFNESRYSQHTDHSHPLPTSNPLPKNTHNLNDNHASGPDPDQGSMLFAPSRDSLNSTDVSFLRLSASMPSPSRTDEGAAHTDKDGFPSSQGTASDAEQKTINSYASPRTSLVYSESSPSTSATSPLTPTLPIHRFSTLSTQSRPPSHPPPAVPSNDQRRHSRRRTDSSEAIVLGEETDDTKENDEFPIWALGWSNDQNVTTVH